MKYIDLHSHTNHSDGVCSVAEVLQTAEAAKLDLFALSDHNAVSAYDELADCRPLFSGAILPATELSVSFRGEAVEVLGYGIDVAQMDVYIKSHYMTLIEKKRAEAGLLAKELSAKGVKLDPAFVEMVMEEPDRIENFATHGSRPTYLDQIRRFPENVRFFESEEEFYGMDRHRWYRHYLSNPNSPLYVDQTVFFPTLKAAVEEIHRQGGLAFLAHAFVYSPMIVQSLDGLVAETGVDGLECHYGTFTPEQKKFLSEYCDRHDLFKSGGSDFHGLSFRPNNFMGRSADERIEFSLIEPWFDKIKEKLI